MREPETPLSDRPIVLPPRVPVGVLADACRSTALSFLRGAGRGWGKRELAAWLAGPYRAVTAVAAADLAHADRARAAAARTERARAAGAVETDRVVDLLERATREGRATLASLCDPDLGVAFAYEALEAGHVHRCVDEAGATGWCPVDLPRLTLRERVASLVAADYLVRAEDYERRLFLCEECGAVRFDAEAVALRLCPEHARPSRVRIPAARPSAPSH